MTRIAEATAAALALIGVVIGGGFLFAAGEIQKWIDRRPR